MSARIAAQIGADDEVPPIVVQPIPPVGPFSDVVEGPGGRAAEKIVMPRD
jgi:hypothetical protein